VSATQLIEANRSLGDRGISDSGSHAKSVKSAALEIVDILKVPADRKNAATDEILSALGWIEIDEKYHGSRQDLGRSFERIASLCDKLLLELSQLSRRGQDILFNSDPWENNDTFKKYVLAVETMRLKAQFIRRGKRAPHRPRDSIKDSFVASITSNLYRAAKKNGGKLTLGFNVNKRIANGTLPAALRVLHEHFPKLVPVNIPYQTLRRRRRSAEKWYGDGSIRRPPSAKAMAAQRASEGG
jgi:hypothetical protein